MSLNVGSSYHQHVYTPETFRRLVDAAAERVMELKRHTGFDTLAFRGSSGAAVAYPVSYKTGLQLIYVRKPNEDTHGRPLEGPNREICRYLIIDDVVFSGSTLEHILNALATATCVGVLLYCEQSMSVRAAGGRELRAWSLKPNWQLKPEQLP